MNVRIRVDWIDRLIRMIHEEPECQELVQKVNTLKMYVKEVEVYYNQLKNLLKQTDESLQRRTWTLLWW